MEARVPDPMSERLNNVQTIALGSNPIDLFGVVIVGVLAVLKLSL